MHPKQLDAIERWNLLLSAFLVAGAGLFFDDRVLLGVLVGCVLACANFWGIHRLVLGSMRAAGSRRTTLQILLGAKMAILMLLVFVAVYLLPLSAVALAIGLSVFLLSIGIESVRFALGRGEENGRA
jgi:hypothetical protein